MTMSFHQLSLGLLLFSIKNFEISFKRLVPALNFAADAAG